MPCLEKYQCSTHIVSESKPQRPLSPRSMRDCYRKKRVNIHRLWEISLKWKKIRAMDFCFFEVMYPFENLTKAADPSSLPLLPLQNGYPYNIFPSMGNPWTAMASG